MRKVDECVTGPEPSRVPGLCPCTDRPAVSKRPDLQSPRSLHRQKSHSEPEHGVFLLPLQSLPVSSWLLVQGVNRVFSRGSWVLPRNSTQQTLDRKAVLKARSTVNTRDPPLQIKPGQDSLPAVFLQKAAYLHSFPAPLFPGCTCYF